MKKQNANQNVTQSNEMMNSNDFENLSFKPSRKGFYSVLAGAAMFAALVVGQQANSTQPTTHSQAPISAPRGNDAPSLKEIMGNLTVKTISQKEATSLMNDAPSLKVIESRIQIETENTPKSDLLSSRSKKNPHAG